MTTYITGILLGAGTLTGFLLMTLIWETAKHLISETPYYIYKIKERLK